MRMAFYGTLRPEESNHYEVRSIPGTWRTGTVRGWTYDITWGPADGYPGMTLDTGAPATPVHVLEADSSSISAASTTSKAPAIAGSSRVTYDDGSTGTAWLYEADPEA